MDELVAHIMTYLILAVAILAFVVLASASIHFISRGRWRKNKQQCLALIGQLDTLAPEEIPPHILSLKQSFQIDVIESALDEYGRQTVDRAKLADIYDQLGLIDRYTHMLKKAGASRSERAKAIECLGKTGHVKAVPPLMTDLQDAREEREVWDAAIRSLGMIRDERAIPLLIDGLALPDQAACQALADLLIGFGDRALEALLNMFFSSKLESQRFWVVYILGRIKHRKAIPALTVALTDHAAKVRAEAAKGLGNIGDSEAVYYLNQVLLEDADALVRGAAANALGAIADERSLAVLTAGLADTDLETRCRSIEALEKMGARAVPVLLEALKNGSWEIQQEAASALEHMGVVAAAIEKLDGPEVNEMTELLRLVAGAGVVDILCRSLRHARLKVRILLCRILAEIPQQEAFDALTEQAQNDSEWAGRLEALLALVKLSDMRSLPILAHALQEEEKMVREGLLYAFKDASLALLEGLWQPLSLCLGDENILIRIRAASVLFRLELPCVVPVFLESLADSVWEVRKIAAEALGRVKRNDHVVKSLMAALKDPSVEVRVEAVRSLGQIRDPQALGPLVDAFEWADEDARNEISIALIAMSEDFLKLTDLLMGLPHAKSRAGAVWTLGVMNKEKNIPLIAKFLGDPDPTVRAVAAISLGRLGSFSTMVRFALMEGLTDPNEWVRASVVGVLGRHGDPSLVKTFVDMLAEEPDATVCQNLVLAIGCLGDAGKHPYALPAIKQWLKKSPDGKSQAAGLIALALFNEESSAQAIFSAIQEPSLRLWIKRLLKECPIEIQRRFCAFVSLDPRFFWSDQEEKSREYYKEILCSSHEVTQRIHAIQALALSKDKAALPLIESAFTKDPSPKVRQIALIALGMLLDSREILKIIDKAVLDPSFEVRASMLPIVRHLDPEDLQGWREKLIPLLESPEEEIRRPVSALLGSLYSHDWQILADQLMGSNQRSRIIGLIETLGAIGDAAAARFFRHFMDHADPEVRSASAEAACRAGCFSREDWMKCLKDPQEAVRLSAIRGLSRLLDGETVGTFSPLSEDPMWDIRLEIAQLLGRQKFSAFEQQVAILTRLSRDANAGVQIAALLALLRLGVKRDPGEIGSIASKLPKKELDLIVANLQKEGVLAELVSVLQCDHDAANRRAALEVLAGLDFPHYMQEIAGALQDPASEVRLRAVEILGQSGEAWIQQAIEALSQDPVVDIREAVKTNKLKNIQ